MVECAEAREAWKQKIFKEKAQNRYYCYATSVPTLMKIHPGRPNIHTVTNQNFRFKIKKWKPLKNEEFLGFDH